MMNDLVEKYNYFIDNFDKIYNKKDKEKAFSLLDNYLGYAINNDVENNSEYKQIYYQLIAPLGLIYKRNMPYMLLVLTSTIIFLAIILNVLLFIFKRVHIYFVILNFICLLFYLLIKFYSKKGNVYCYNF
jgi:hypothetical protein